jgi:phosphoribosyl-ATP pyrophosphohydrolase
MSTTLSTLYQTIEQRKLTAPAESYTGKLFAAGQNEILKKVGEEAIEVLIAASSETDERLISELADLLYHCTVLLSARDLSWEAVDAELAKRMK